MKSGNFFAELKRRNVVRMAGLYLVGACDGGLGLMRCDPFLANLREDPRWNSFLHTMGLAEDQLK